MKYQLVFCDIDGTLLNSDLEILPGTLKALQSLKRQNIPFVIVSGRSPIGIYPVQKRYKLKTPIISFSGGLIQDEDRKILYSRCLFREQVTDVIDFLEKNHPECTWNIYYGETWIVKDKSNPLIAMEEKVIDACAITGTVDLLPADAQMGKVLGICPPGKLLDIENDVKNAFPSLAITTSSEKFLEINQTGASKGNAIRELCRMWHISTENAVAFGDNFNDVEMLKAVGTPFLMGNAPSKLKEEFSSLTASNDDEGIYKALKKIGLI